MIDPFATGSKLTPQQWKFRARVLEAHLDRFSQDELMRGRRVDEIPHLRSPASDAHGYNPNQRRVPAGHPDGGQWTDEGSAEVSGSQPDPKRPGHVASFLTDRGTTTHSGERGEQYASLTSIKDFEEPTRTRDSARHYAENQRGEQYSDFNQLSVADKIAVEKTTQILSETLASVNQVVARRRDLVSARLYGIAVHKAFADAVRAKNLPGIGIEGVEQSFDILGFARYGLAGSIRTDVVLRNEKGIIIAIYDVKTGDAMMHGPREAKIRKYSKAHPAAELIILRARRPIR